MTITGNSITLKKKKKPSRPNASQYRKKRNKSDFDQLLIFAQSIHLYELLDNVNRYNLRPKTRNRSINTKLTALFEEDPKMCEISPIFVTHTGQDFFRKKNVKNPNLVSPDST